MVHVQVDDCAFQIEICSSQNIPFKEYPIPADPASDPEGSQKYQYHACPYKLNQPHQHVYIESPPSNRPQTYHINIEPFRFFRYNKCYGFYFFPSFDGVSPSYGKKLTKQTIQRVKFDMIAKGRVPDGTTSATLAYLKERETETHLVQFNMSGEGTIRIAWVEIEDPNLSKAVVVDSSVPSKRTMTSNQPKEGMLGRSTSSQASDQDDRSDGGCWKSKARQLIDNMDVRLRAMQTSINEYNHNYGYTSSATEAEMSSGSITPPDEFTGSSATTRASTPIINPKASERPKLNRRGSSHLRAWITKKIGHLDLSCRCVREERKAKEKLFDKEEQAVNEEHSCETPNTVTSGENTTADTTPTSKKTTLEDIAEFTLGDDQTNLSIGAPAVAQSALNLEKTTVVAKEEALEDAKKAKDVKKSKEELGLPRTYQLRSITFHYRTKGKSFFFLYVLQTNMLLQSSFRHSVSSLEILLVPDPFAAFQPMVPQSPWNVTQPTRFHSPPPPTKSPESIELDRIQIKLTAMRICLTAKPRTKSHSRDGYGKRMQMICIMGSLPEEVDWVMELNRSAFTGRIYHNSCWC